MAQNFLSPNAGVLNATLGVPSAINGISIEEFRKQFSKPSTGRQYLLSSVQTATASVVKEIDQSATEVMVVWGI
jgi:hypothetical protein